MKLGISLAASPGTPGGDAALSIATEARRAGHEVYLYLIDDGARYVDEATAGTLSAQSASGAKLFICAYSCQKRGLPSAGIEGAVYCGLGTLSDIMKSCDKFVAFC